MKKNKINTMEQQSATEWLFHRLWDTPKDKFTWYAILEQAKEMEKQQIIDDRVSAPLKSQFFKWARDKYDIYFYILKDEIYEDELYVWDLGVYVGMNVEYTETYHTYEQAEDACINKIIELLKLK